ncbi:tRNA (adenosine(37)-N6)-dimethylallyltransferase MiaA [Clostridia bacterium]|nr:tRNA (adenosine(37)-N6)-dimethylallyltransferase MiaA [Clostridia bacterium]
MKNKVVAILGPTASGKSDLAVELADRVGGEIISCDSVQLYRGLDIGSGKVTEREKIASSGRKIVHHMLDVCDPVDEFTAYDYQKSARRAVEAVIASEKIPILCGGTGLYFKSVVDDYHYENEPDEKQIEIQNKYLKLLDEQGKEAMHRLLAAKDPEAAKTYHQNNVRRVIRALVRLEMDYATVDEIKSEPYYHVLGYGLQVDRTVLYKRIDARVEEMLAQGILEETKGLLMRGVPREHKIMNTLGYRHMLQFMDGIIDWDEAVRLMKRDTRRYAKRQYTWFKRDARIQWLPYDSKEDREVNLSIMESGISNFF